MKKCFIVIFGIMFIVSFANGQYKINKTKYDYHSYKYQPDDPYYPLVAGVASVFLPGLGQMVTKEVGRGVAFMGGLLVLGFVDQLIMYGEIELSDAGEYLIGGPVILGTVGVYLWSIGDAVRVAKVNNLSFRDKNNTSFNFQVQPYINTTYIKQNESFPVGLTLRIKF
jgi:hypothetical protein